MLRQLEDGILTLDGVPTPLASVVLVDVMKCLNRPPASCITRIGLLDCIRYNAGSLGGFVK